jgi:hypothetical protein
MHELETTHEADAEGTVMRVVEELAPRILQSLYERTAASGAGVARGTAHVRRATLRPMKGRLRPT